MFVYSLRASTLRFFSVIALSLAVLITLVALVPTYAVDSEQAASFDYERVKNDDDAERFLSQFGWIVDATPTEVAEVTMPSEFDKIFAAYNEIQRGQGLDLTKYKGKTVQRYTYEITNYDGYNGVVYANIIVYRNKVIAGDVCSADVSGFMHGLERTVQ